MQSVLSGLKAMGICRMLRFVVRLLVPCHTTVSRDPAESDGFVSGVQGYDVFLYLANKRVAGAKILKGLHGT